MTPSLALLVLFNVAMGQLCVESLQYETSSASCSSPRGALADLCCDCTCKQPRGQALFFLVEHGHPEMLPAVRAEELWEMLEGTIL